MFGHAAPREVLATWARADAALTHPHSVCQDASAVYAVAIAHAIGTGAKASVKNAISSLGSNLIVVIPGSAQQGGVRTGAGGAGTLS